MEPKHCFLARCYGGVESFEMYRRKPGFAAPHHLVGWRCSDRGALSSPNPKVTKQIRSLRNKGHSVNEESVAHRFAKMGLALAATMAGREVTLPILS